MEDQPAFEIEQPTAPEQPAAMAAEQRYKTLGVRLEEGLHAQLSFIAQLTGSTLADEIRSAIEGRVLAAQTDPALVARAEAVRTEIEREAAARRQAIAGFFGHISVEHGDQGGDAPAAPAAELPKTSRPRRTITPRGSAD